MLDYLRSRYGEVYVTSFPDRGIDVPWRPLSYGDFVYYMELLEAPTVASAFIEDEIFNKCVVNKAVTDRIDLLPAGIISTVVTQIMGASGPVTIDEFNQKLADQRQHMESPLHLAITVICRAFPGYTPEDIYKLDYNTVMLRLAQSEKLLIDAKILSEPIVLYSAEEQQRKQEQVPQKVAPPELKSAWETAMKFKDLNPNQERKPAERPAKPPEKAKTAPPRPMPKNVPDINDAKKPVGWDSTKSPVLQKRANIDTNKENSAMTSASSGARSGWDMIDEPLVRHQVVEDARIIYKDLLAKLAEEQKQKSQK